MKGRKCMNSIKWIPKNYKYIVFFTVYFFSLQGTYSVLIRYCVHIRKLVQKIDLLQILFRYVPAIWYKRCAQIFVSSVNKSAIRYAFRNAKESYMEHGLTYPILFKQNIQMKCTCKPKTLWKNISEGHQFPISISYPTVPSTIWPIFSEFLIFYCLISRAFSRVK